MLKRVTWTLRANCQEEHGQLCPPSGIPPREVLDGTARKAHGVQGQCTVFVSSPSATLSKAGISAGSLRLALGACVSLPTITRPLPYAWMSGCLPMYNRWLCSPSGLPAPLNSKLSSWLLAPAQSWPGNYQLLLVMTWPMMDKCCTPSSRSLTKLKYPVLKKQTNKNPTKHKVSRFTIIKQSPAGRADAKPMSRAVREAAGWSLCLHLPLGPAAGAWPCAFEDQLQDGETRTP